MSPYHLLAEDVDSGDAFGALMPCFLADLLDNNIPKIKIILLPFLSLFTISCVYRSNVALTRSNTFSNLYSNRPHPNLTDIIMLSERFLNLIIGYVVTE